MTSPNGEIPSGAYVSGGSGQSGLSDLNTLTEGVARQRMQGAVSPSFNRHRDGVWGNNTALIEMITGRYGGPIQEFIDGQLELNERISLLGKSGYCTLTMSMNAGIGPNKLRALPFDTQVGPAQRAEHVVVNRQHPGSGTEFRDEHCIKLLSPGLWQINVSAVQNQVSAATFAEIVVLKPDLTPYSYTTSPTAAGRNTGAPPGAGAPINLFKMVVVPDPGYLVQVRWMWPAIDVGIGRIYGGTKYSQFSVTQWSDEVANINAPEEVGDGPEIT